MDGIRDLLERQIDQALGRSPADLVVRNARVLNLVTGELEPGDIAVCGGTIVGTLDSYRGREEIDAQGRFVVPEEHRTHAAITREVKVLGQHTRIEVWDATRFADMEGGKSADEVSAEIRRLRIV